MTDLREGRIQAFLDLEMPPEGRRLFIAEMAEDAALSAAVDTQRARINAVETVLGQTFGNGPALEQAEIVEAWTRVAAQIGVPDEGSPAVGLSRVDPDENTDGTERVSAEAPALRSRVRRRGTFSTPAKAAGLLLVAAGAAAAAIPGSPLRNWVENFVATPAEVTVAPAAVTASTGVRLPVHDGPLVVVLPQAMASERLTISVVDGDMVEVLADADTRFSTSRGRVELADVTGPVTVRIPKAQVMATVEVGGTVYLRKSGERVEVLQEADSLPSEFVFGERNGAPSR